MSILPDNNLDLDCWLENKNIASQKLLKNALLQKDVWHTIDDLVLAVNQHKKTLTIDFSSIQQDWLKLLTKLYTLVRSGRKLSASYIKNDVHYLTQFSKFIEQKSIFSSEQINEQLFDEFDYYLHSSKLSLRSISLQYMALINFFNLCREEGWLEVNTYWFKGKYKKSTPNNDDIEYIPEEVWRQLAECLHYLPEQIQRMVIIIRSTGLRIGELVNLPFDCLRQRDNQWRLRFVTEKYQTVDEIPICKELVVTIQEQQEYIMQHLGGSYNNLFGGNDGRGKNIYIPSARIMHSDGFNRWLNKLAKKHNICDANNKVWHFKSHQFRKTFATIMDNAGVRSLIIQYYLRHRSPDMQNHYKHLFKQVLGEEYKELMNGTSYANSTGELIAVQQPQNPITELLRRKMYQVTTQYGECHRPVLKSPCQTVNACPNCEYWLTSINDLPALKDDLSRIDAELEIAFRLGMVRQEKGLSIDRKNLIIRIETLEIINNDN